MTFNAAVPLNSDSPAIFPAQNQTNMARLQTIVGADHQFNLSAAADDGYHNVVHLTQQSPTGVLAATGRLYANSVSGRVNLWYMDDQAAQSLVTPTMPTRAAVNFNGTSGVGAQTIRSQMNVNTVMKTGTGSYTINFTGFIPDANYMVAVTGMRTGSNNPVMGTVASNNTYGNSVTTSLVKVQFFSDSGSLVDVLMGNVIVRSAT